MDKTNKTYISIGCSENNTHCNRNYFPSFKTLNAHLTPSLIVCSPRGRLQNGHSSSSDQSSEGLSSYGNFGGGSLEALKILG